MRGERITIRESDGGVVVFGGGRASKIAHDCFALRFSFPFPTDADDFLMRATATATAIMGGTEGLRHWRSKATEA